jgi:signal peptidase I
VLGALGLVLLVVASRVLILEGYGIGSESMEDSLLQGDLVLVERLSYGSEWIPDFGAPDVGDVVVFRRPEDGGVMVKRCVATAGQRVLIKNKVLHVDGVRAADPARSKYLDATIRPAKQSSRDHFGPYVVPPGHIFVLGDNRDASVDSRFFGPVSQPLLIGRAIAVLWPASRPNRWSRLGNGVD